MISEVTFAKRFTSFWNQLLPGANGYMRLINEGQLEVIEPPMAPPDNSSLISLVNVMAFEIFRSCILAGADVESNRRSSDPASVDIERVFDVANNHQARFDNYNQPNHNLSRNDIEQACDIATRLMRQYGGRRPIEIDPRFDGCGFVNPSNGDIFLDHILVEVKSYSSRSFQLADLRQVLVYCSLNISADAPRELETIEICNPRMGVRFTEQIDRFTMGISALYPQELFYEIQQFMSEVQFAGPVTE